ncbi:MAG: ATP-binding cassette domain-containing protein [Campylobacteraceae bacterium]|jgi:ATPase subunit of ABC transporter with duplicated ATPase domains|nr:ATP-binding cassette domain-containing protein [Campylobacteraceae bacterium]
MNSLSFNNLSFIYDGSSQAVFQDISLQIYRGWTGIVGKSGAGKTTLAKVIAQNAKIPSYYAEQRTDNAPQNAKDFINAADKEAVLTRGRLDIKDDWVDKWDKLSHGERKRLQIGAALYENPELLIIDEPTNHLDAQARDYLISALEKYGGFGLLISHDRELLDRLCKRTIFVEDGGADIRANAYSIAASERENERHFAEKRRDIHSKEIKKLEKMTQARREKAEQSRKRISKRGIDPKDSDMKERIGRAIVSGKDAVDTNILSRFQSRLRQSEAKMEAIAARYETGVTIEAGRYAKLFPINFENRAIEEHSRIGIFGRNGSGKSRFVERFVKSREWSAGEALYLPQEIDADKSAKLLENIKKMKNDEKGFLMSLIVRLGSDPKTLLQSSSPSPGETRKLLFSLGLLQKPALVIMDEPTNHLDIISIEALENALKSYNGALLLVSHDRRFLANVTNEIWQF